MRRGIYPHTSRKIHPVGDNVVAADEISERVIAQPDGFRSRNLRNGNADNQRRNCEKLFHDVTTFQLDEELSVTGAFFVRNISCKNSSCKRL